MKAPELTENEIQRAVFANFTARSSPFVFAFHPKNGGVHQVGRRAGINSGLGVVSGIPDIVIFKVNSFGHTVVYALELKREGRRGKTPTQHELDQERTRHRMTECGVLCGVVYGLDEALAWLEEAGLLIGKSL